MTFQVPQPSGDLQSWAMTLSAELQREINQIESTRLEEQERHSKVEKLQANRITELEQTLSQVKNSQNESVNQLTQTVEGLEQSLSTILTRLNDQDTALADLDARVTQLENA